MNRGHGSHTRYNENEWKRRRFSKTLNGKGAYIINNKKIIRTLKRKETKTEQTEYRTIEAV